MAFFDFDFGLGTWGRVVWLGWPLKRGEGGEMSGMQVKEPCRRGHGPIGGWEYKKGGQRGCVQSTYS
jgi:hypothetical protein